MTDTNFKQPSKLLDAFSAPSLDEQERLCVPASRKTWCIRTLAWKAKDYISRAHRRFSARFPGHYLRVSWFRQQHGQLLSEWTKVSEEDLVIAHSYHRLNELGRIAQLAGFWRPGSV